MNKHVSWIAGVLLACGLAVGAAAIAQEHPPDSPKIEAAGRQWLALMNKDNDKTIIRSTKRNFSITWRRNSPRPIPTTMALSTPVSWVSCE